MVLNHCPDKPVRGHPERAGGYGHQVAAPRPIAIHGAAQTTQTVVVTLPEIPTSTVACQPVGEAPTVEGTGPFATGPWL